MDKPLFALFFVMVSAATAAQAQSGAASSQPDAASMRPAADALSLRGPQYQALRFNEDFSYLDGPAGSYRRDFFDPIKNIHLGSDWRLRLGGELRSRFESETNKSFGARDPGHDAFLLQRTFLHADLKYRDAFRTFFEFADNAVFDRDLPQSPGHENRSDINQVFLDWRIAGSQACPLTLRAGRQEMAYGRERVLAPSDWGNTPRRFDGFKLIYKTPSLDLDFFWVRPVVFENRQFGNSYFTNVNEGMNRKPDHYREEQQLFGAYASYKGIRNHVIDVYFLGLTDNGYYANANTHRGDITLYTLGGRFGGVTGDFDYDVEGNGQWGKWAGDDVKAWMLATDEGYTFSRLPMTPRVGVGFDFASGDDTPRDRTHETYHLLFPTSHQYLGFLDLVGRQNIIAPNVNLTLKPHRDVVARLFWYHFWLDSNLDSLYSPTQASARRNVSGSSGNDVGDELDATVAWQIDVHSNLLVGWSHFWPGSFINTSGFSRDADLVYVQYQFKF